MINPVVIDGALAPINERLILLQKRVADSNDTIGKLEKDLLVLRESVINTTTEVLQLQQLRDAVLDLHKKAQP